MKNIVIIDVVKEFVDQVSETRGLFGSDFLMGCMLGITKYNSFSEDLKQFLHQKEEYYVHVSQTDVLEQSIAVVKEKYLEKKLSLEKKMSPDSDYYSSRFRMVNQNRNGKSGDGFRIIDPHEEINKERQKDIDDLANITTRLEILDAFLS